MADLTMARLKDEERKIREREREFASKYGANAVYDSPELAKEYRRNIAYPRHLNLRGQEAYEYRRDGGNNNGASGPAKGAMGNLGQAPSAPQSQSRGRYTWEGSGESSAPVNTPPPGQQPKPALGDDNKPAPATVPESTTISGPGGFKARRTRNDDGTYTLTMGKPNEAGYGTMTYSRQRAPGSNVEYAGRRETMRGGNYGYDPQEARQAQASKYIPSKYIPPAGYERETVYYDPNGIGRTSGSPLFNYVPIPGWGASAGAQPQMPEAPKGGWQTKLRAYQTQMDAYNQALNRQQAMEIARMGDARQGGQLGFQQDQLRQQLMLGLMGHDLQADQNAVNRAKALAEMQAAALGMQSQQAQLGLQQGVMDAYANGTPEEQENMTRLYQALYGKGKTSDKATRSPWRYVPGRGDDEGAAAGMLVNQETGETRVVDGMTPAQQYYYGTLYQTLSKEMRDSIEGMPALARNAVIERMYREALANQEKNKKK